mmetsp:Transcript_42351/g.100508  ORF Transcript_42351/g.100508 Transcript_42351/m.100508 type:complete len:308 (-) Transcript_42351:167-1090(-)
MLVRFHTAKHRNRERSKRNKTNRKSRNEVNRQQEEQELQALTPEEAAARKEEAYQRRVKAHLEQQERVREGLAHGVRVVVECSFIHEFSDREVRSMAKQLEYSVVSNKRAARPTALTFCSWEGAIASFAAKMGADGWPVNKDGRDVLEAFPPEKVVVLSPDADEVLGDLRDGDVYCIGGIVDRTTKKNATKQWAEANGLRSARLPIDECLPLEAGTRRHAKRNVLNINDVVTALVEFNSTHDWKLSLEAALPQRKKASDVSAKQSRRKRKPDEHGGTPDNGDKQPQRDADENGLGGADGEIDAIEVK